MNLATLRSPSAAMTPAQKRRAAWLASENLIGHLAERVKIRALQPDPETSDPDPAPVDPEVGL